jgi:hypothetical protein
VKKEQNGEMKMQPKLDEMEYVSNRRLCALVDENWQLKQKCCQIEFLLKKITEEKNRMDSLHRHEIRWREKKELYHFIVVALCAMLYVVVALATRGFV